MRKELSFRASSRPFSKTVAKNEELRRRIPSLSLCSVGTASEIQESTAAPRHFKSAAFKLSTARSATVLSGGVCQDVPRGPRDLSEAST